MDPTHLLVSFIKINKLQLASQFQNNFRELL